MAVIEIRLWIGPVYHVLDKNRTSLEPDADGSCLLHTVDEILELEGLTPDRYWVPVGPYADYLKWSEVDFIESVETNDDSSAKIIPFKLRAVKGGKGEGERV